MVLLLAAARGKHGRRAMGVGVEWIEELLWLAGRANRGGAVESAGWWVEENEEGNPQVDRDQVAAGWIPREWRRGGGLMGHGSLILGFV